MREQTMERTDLPLAELKALLQVVSESGVQHLLEVEADLTQTLFLLDEAIAKLSVSFTAIHQAVSEQQARLDALLTQYPLIHQQAYAIYEMREVISDEVNGAVTGLQFHDLTSQLLTRTLGRVNGLRDLLLTLPLQADEAHPAADVAARLRQLSEGLQRHSVALDGRLTQPVRQQHLGCGDVELF